MTSFNNHMGDYTLNQTKKGWLTSILELGAWTGTMYSGFLAEIISRKYAILVNTAIFIIGVVIQDTAVTSAGPSAIMGGRFITGQYTYPSHSDYKLTVRDRYGRWFTLDDRPYVQRRVCASRRSVISLTPGVDDDELTPTSQRSLGGSATAGHHAWHHDFLLD